MAVESPHAGRDQSDMLQTVLGLFDDHIDAEQALLALRKATAHPEQVSLIVRDRAAEDVGTLERSEAVARVLVATALDAVGGWLQGLASLIVPRHGTFLVAGPIGAALTGPPDADGATHPTGFDALTDPGALKLNLAIQEFGFDADESEYIERRLEAGAALIAVTSQDEISARHSQRLFAENSAVHIGRAQTDQERASQLAALLTETRRSSTSNGIVVADAVAPLNHLCTAVDSDGSTPPCGVPVVDDEGEAIGAISDVLVDPSSLGTDGSPIVRYVVVSFGGVFRIGRRHVPIPANLVALQEEPVRLALDRARLEAAPSVGLGQPVSRREEQQVCEYFNIPCYWEE
jgi:hypothetical protein